jgi:cathepsin B
MKATLLLLVVAIAAVQADDMPVPFTNCGSPPEHLTITQATADPWPPVLGQDIVFTVAGTLDEEVDSSANFEVLAWFDGIQLADYKGTLAQLGIQSLPPTNFNITKRASLPWLPIVGDVKIQASLIDQNGQWVACIVVDVNLGAAPARPALDRLINTVNQDSTIGWRAGHNPYFEHRSIQGIHRMMGVVKNPALQLPDRAPFATSVISALPQSVDLRTRRYGKRNHTNCIGPVLDQGECGSCWAFGAAEAISDRVCMKDGSFLQLAPLDLVTCDQMDGGCQGGDPGSAWQYAQQGLTTEKCFPYLTAEGGPIPTCPPSQEPCLNFVDTPACPNSCADGSPLSRTHSVDQVYGVSGVQQIMAEIDQHGPVEVAFTVYADFLTYKSGVYTYQSGDALGGHAVKMIGYGTEGGVDYWLCQNSWTTTWGDKGYFKIRRGTDECGIEDDVVAGTIAQ